MSYLLSNNSLDNKVIVANESQVNIGLDEYWFEFAGVMPPTSVLKPIYASSFQNFRNGIFTATTGRIGFYVAGALRMSVTGWHPGDFAYHVYRFEHDTNGDWRFKVDGVVTVTGNFVTSFTMRCKDFYAWGNLTNNEAPTIWGLHYFKTGGAWTNPDEWNADLSNGVGNLLLSVSGTNNGTLTNYPSTDEQWSLYSPANPATGVSKVGEGWPIGERHFRSLNEWVTARSGSGIYETALIRGSVTTADVNINGAFTAGALVEGFVPYDGLNAANIAFTGGNHAVTITSANVLVKDLRVDYNNNFVTATTVQGNNSFFERCLIIQRGTGATTGCVTLNSVATNKGIKNSVLYRTAGGALLATGFDRDAIFENNIGFGYTGSFSSGSANRLSVSNNFLFENTGSTFSGGSYLSFTNNATLDATGNLTGYTNAELVDFAGGDYRVKSTSDLFDLNIGAFFESGGSSDDRTGTFASAVNFSLGTSVQKSILSTLASNTVILLNNSSSSSRLTTVSAAMDIATASSQQKTANSTVSPAVGIYSNTSQLKGTATELETNIYLLPELDVSKSSNNSLEIISNLLLSPAARKGAVTSLASSTTLNSNTSSSKQATGTTGSTAYLSTQYSYSIAYDGVVTINTAFVIGSLVSGYKEANVALQLNSELNASVESGSKNAASNLGTIVGLGYLLDISKGVFASLDSEVRFTSYVLGTSENITVPEFIITYYQNVKSIETYAIDIKTGITYGTSVSS